MNAKRVKIENYQMVNSLILRLAEEKMSLIVWQKNQKIKFETKIKNILWHAYSFELDALGVDRTEIEKEKSVFCYIPELMIIFKTKWTRISPYALMLAIPESFIDLRNREGHNREELLKELQDFNIFAGLKLIPSREATLAAKEKSLQNYRYYPRKKASANIFFKIAQKEKIGWEVFGKEKSFKLYDLSRNGLSFLTLAQDQSLQVGELIQIRMPHSHLVIKGKIVRMAKNSAENGEELRIGVKFLSYRKHLIDSI